MDSYLVWSLVLFAVGAVIVVLEVILPSGGLLAVAALAALAGSLYCAYQLSGWVVAAIAVVEAVCIPLLVVFGFKVLPRTTLGRTMMLRPPSPARRDSSAMDANACDDLVGREGQAITLLRPSGTAVIAGQHMSVVTHGEAMPPGTRVRVILVQGNRIVVEAIKE